MKKHILILILVVGFYTELPAQSIALTPVADALVNINDVCTAWQTTNYGAATYLYATTWTWYGPGCGQGNIRSFLWFDMNLPANPHSLYDNRAMLFLYYPTGSTEYQQYTGSATDNQFYIQRVTASWTELGITWNNQPGFTGAGQITVPSCSPNPSSQDYTIDISTHVYEWLCNGVPNYGIRLAQVNEGNIYRRVSFASKEFADTTRRPRLVLEYAEIAASAPDTICQGDPFSLSCSLSNAAVPAQYQFQWTHLNTSTTYNTQNVNSPANVPGLNTYVVHVTNPWCQSADDTVTVLITAQPVAQANSNSPVCFNGTLNLTASGGLNYQWTGPNGFTSNLQNPTVPGMTAADSGTYMVIVTNGVNCTDTAYTFVSVQALLSVIAGSNSPVCEGETLNLTSSAGGSTYQWTGPNSFSASVQNPSIAAVSPAASGTYTVNISDSVGCSGIANVTVVVNSAPLLNCIPASSIICEGMSDTLAVTGATNYNWSPASGLNTTAGSVVIATPASTTTYTITGDSLGCTSSTTLTVTVNPAVQANAGSNDAICPGESVQFSASGGSSYLWSPQTGLNNPNIYNPIASPDTTTVYTVIVSNGLCDPDTASLTLTVYPNASVDAGSDTTIIPGGNTQLQASGGTSWEWTPDYGLSCTDCANPVASPDETTTYTVTATDGNGCQATDFVTIVVFIECGSVYIPNAFSPNGDGFNDVLFVRGNCLESMNFIVYDRWGDKVFNSTASAEGWDGTYKDKPLDRGVFYYNLKAKLYDGTEIRRKGSISLLR